MKTVITDNARPASKVAKGGAKSPAVTQPVETKGTGYTNEQQAALFWARRRRRKRLGVVP